MHPSCRQTAALWRRRMGLGLVCAGLLPAGGLTAQTLEDPFLRSANLNATYPDYGRERYTRYAAGFASRRAIFDRLGQFVNHGTYSLRWNELRDEYTIEKIAAGVPLNQLDARSSVLYQSGIINLEVVRQDYGDQHMSLAVGRSLSTSFTPLVFHQKLYGGLRLDYGTPNQDLTFLLSRGGYMQNSHYSGMWGTVQGWTELSPVLVMGANWRRRMGALEVGATHFRQMQTNLKSSRDGLLRGDVPYPELQSPHMLLIRITDDSPDSGDGVQLFSASVEITGLVDSVEQRQTITATSSQITGNRLGTEAWEAVGPDEQIDIAFALPREMVGLRAGVRLSLDGDYRVAVRQFHDFQQPGADEVERSWPSPPLSAAAGTSFKGRPFEEEPYFTVRRAEGQPQLDGTPTEVRFRHGIPTAQGFHGVDFDLTTERLNLTGEFVLNPQEFKFPTLDGERTREWAHSGYLSALLRLGGAGDVGAEVFRVEPTYGGWYDSRRGGLILFTDVAGRAGGDVFSGEHLGVDARTQEFFFFDDNDDHDNWPDDLWPNGDALYVPGGAFEPPRIYPSRRPEGGVYPGHDMDGDLILDFDRNLNAVMDWVEPFLAYAADPPEFVYGIDFNNNLVPDYRENDDEPDYPYRRDQQGVHLFCDVTRRPWWLSQLRLGWHSSEETAGGNRSRALYGRAGIDLEAPSVWVKFRDDVKRVRDGIRDDVYRLVLTMDHAVSAAWNNPSALPPADFLPMRNSIANTAFVETGWLPLDGLVVENTVKHVLNRQLAETERETLVQEAGTHNNISVINKISYRTGWGRQLKVTGRAKHLLARWDEGSYSPVDSVEVGQEASWSYFMPELLVTYTLTQKTRIEFGQHGLFVPFLRSRFHDRLSNANNFQSNVSILQFTMSGEHFGYSMVTSIGLRRERRYYDRAAARDDSELSAFFVDVIFGPE